MLLRMIVACDSQGGIGKNGRIPWTSRADMRVFRELTTGTGNNGVVMGRGTLESLPAPLKGRKMFVVSRKLPATPRPDVHLCRSLTCAYIHAKASGLDELWVIGGSQLYAETLASPLLDDLHLTMVKGNFKCDTFLTPAVKCDETAYLELRKSGLRVAYEPLDIEPDVKLFYMKK